MKNRILICCIAFTLLPFACTSAPELLENNNPDRYSISKDVLWASPDGFDLTMDIYTPTHGVAPYAVVVMFHGGGWLINDKSIMDQASAYIATNSDYVVCNVNYRLLSDNGNTVTLNQIVEDAFGAVLWVKDHIDGYQGDNSRIAVTGDSAGGHLAAMIVTHGNLLSSNSLSHEALTFGPTYLPMGVMAEQVVHNGLEVQAAILSYGAFDIYQAALDGFEGATNPFWLASGSIPRGVLGDAYNAQDNAELYQALSPIYNIPHATQRHLPPQLLTAGSEDPVVTPASVQAYVHELQAAGHNAQYWEHEGRSHAFLDSGSNVFLGASFEADAPPALDVMIGFLDDVFEP